MSAKLKLITAPPLEDSFRGVAFETNEADTNFTSGEREELYRLIRAYKRMGLLGSPNFIHSSDENSSQKFSGILAPRAEDGLNAFYVFKTTNPKAASEYLLVMRGFVETGKMGERIETVNFPRVMRELRSFFFAQAPHNSHLSLAWNA